MEKFGAKIKQLRFNKGLSQDEVGKGIGIDRSVISKWERGHSAWTIQTEAKALGKLFDIRPDDPDYYDPPKRHRKDIKRSRLPAKRDAHFSKKSNHEFICFCRSTGERISEVSKLKGKDLITRSEIVKENETARDGTWHKATLNDALCFENEYYLHIFDKGGRERYSPIIGEYADLTVARMKATLPENRVWPNVPSNADTHSYRSEYATAIYKQYARNIEDIPYDAINKGTGKKYQSGVYACRKDEKGKNSTKEQC